MTEHVDLTDPHLHEPVGIATADAGQVYHADGVGSGNWTAPAVHYGQMNIIANATAQTTVAATTEQMIGDDVTGKWVTGLVNGVTFSSGDQAMSISDDGVYILDFWCSFTAPNSSDTTFYFSIDGGTTLSSQTMTRTSTSATDVGVLAARAIIELTTSNLVEIHVENSVGGAVYFQDSGMSLLQIKET